MIYFTGSKAHNVHIREIAVRKGLKLNEYGLYRADDGELLAAEAIFLLFFTQWYLSRYLRLWRKLPFWQMVIMILVLCALVFGGSWLWDRWKARKASKVVTHPGTPAQAG